MLVQPDTIQSATGNLELLPQTDNLLSSLSRPVTIAFAGQPNTGKSTIFNKLTGLKQRVGNWPGKTVDKKEGTVDHKGCTYNFVDLPGTYGLTANSLEEEITRDYLLSGEADAIVAVVNAASLERSIYLVAEMLTLNLPIIIALNMMDVAEQEGYAVSAKALSKATGMPVIPLIGTSQEQNMNDLLTSLHTLDLGQAALRTPAIISEEVQKLALKLTEHSSFPKPLLWTAGKIIEQDKSLHNRLQHELTSVDLATYNKLKKGITPKETNAVYLARQQWIEHVCDESVNIIKDHASPTDKWDKLFLHPVWGRIIAFLVIPAGCLLGVILGMCTGGLALMTALSAGPQIKAMWPGMAGNLVATALIPATGWVLALLSIIGFIYAIFHFLEDTGYLARVAYLMDPMLSRLGVDGKAAIPLLMGMLCNTVAIAGSRVIATRRQRFISLCMLPFLPCSGQTGVAFLFAFALFPPATAIKIILSVTAVNIILACSIAKLLHKRLPTTHTSGLIMELPLYHKPNFKTIFSGVRTRLELFARSTAGFIYAAMIIVWAVSYFPEGNLQHSYLFQLGKFLEPVGAVLGFDWRFVVALLSSFVAKETTAGTLAVLFSVDAGNQQAVIEAVRQAITSQGALAFIVLSNLYLPCLATIVALKTELGSWATTAKLLVCMLTIAILAAYIAYTSTAFLF
ncbi:ferrous iron transport protein B [Halodesulfovibrio aestuarii]|uniref:Ferrous iron transport protein B n=1 Tax=Halodesulfovibrio aestuarii TaxID=126333 RepID=A0A8G2CCD3_9BACT|nr:ferrous iron transport protein B [Halodesulfovibrio aestuarii]SHJ55981.1 ferrous iron transport protein B [Halodesulfovibrio aestuarii]